MPGIKVPNEGERHLLEMIRAALEDGGAKVRLHRVIGTPGDAWTIATFAGSGQAQFSGYAAVALTGGAVLPDPDVGGRAVCGWDTVVFTHNGGIMSDIVRGYYVTDAGHTKLYWVENFPEELTIAVNGDSVEVVPQFRLKSEN